MKQSNKAHEGEKVIAIFEEIEASFKLITIGLTTLNEQNSYISNNHVPLQLFASGFERISKILLLLKDKFITGSFPEQQKAKDKFKNYNNGHGIEKMLDELIAYSENVELMQRIPLVREDIYFIKNDIQFRQFIKIITEFSIQQRYYYIDAIVLENSNQNFNPFAEFKRLIYSFGGDTDLSKLTYKQEERVFLEGMIVCIEKGIRAISRFFTHGLGEVGKQHYMDFSNFILLKDEDLGNLKYTKKKVYPSNLYKPINIYSFAFARIALLSKSKTLKSLDFTPWAFNVDSVRVYYTGTNFYFAKIANEVFALTGKTSTKYKIPVYFASTKLKPKAVALYLLDEAKKLNSCP